VFHSSAPDIFEIPVILNMATDLDSTVDLSSDEVLVRQSIEGHWPSFDELVRRHQQMVGACLFPLCRNHADLEDLVQETFVRVHTKLAMWKPGGSFPAWIRRIAYNLAHDHLRKLRRNPLHLVRLPGSQGGTQDLGSEIDRMASRDPDPAAESDQNDWIDWLLGLLKPDEALLMTLYCIDELPIEVIADRLGWGLSKVKVTVHRIRKKLKSSDLHEGSFRTRLASIS
jgi:RNA polymerase sigma-70 factor (ECF subfamily)